MNPALTSTAVSLSGYAHSVVLSGSDILDGAQVAFDGPALTTLAAQSAAVVVP